MVERFFFNIGVMTKEEKMPVERDRQERGEITEIKELKAKAQR